jgi:hypothetical protein
MNHSKKNDPRCWQTWALSGAVSGIVLRNVAHRLATVRFTDGGQRTFEGMLATINRLGYRPANAAHPAPRLFLFIRK